ncbi:uncharacterized protein LOC111897237 [Lactuca sativa]|uniref:uncharacterized protein LOC111897237 n=1 Tax=Lactuca sativa TaxID=4236 RepID=UPI000CD848EE|nr:uncharacterized protein LOC111897237 [Lactuca sativa]
MKPDETTHQLRICLQKIFQDNKTTRSVYLEEQFNNTHLPVFSNLSDYYARLKNLSDQLANVKKPISKENMVPQLVFGLTKGDFDTVATVIQQSDPLPNFNKARSQLLLEETRRNNQDSHLQQAMITQQPDQPISDTPPTTQHGTG